MVKALQKRWKQRNRKRWDFYSSI